MFKAKTVFVIGAGASCEFGLPSGDTLKTKVSELVDLKFPHGFDLNGGNAPFVTAIHSHMISIGNNDINLYLQKCEQLKRALPLTISIDNLLEAHHSNELLILCGKVDITQSILQSERNSKIFYDSSTNSKLEPAQYVETWIGKFFRCLTENVTTDNIEDIFNNITLIVFNYDRCIEIVLLNALINYYFIEERKAQDILEKLSIYHPYGSVGSLPWLYKHDSVDFGATISGPYLLKISNGIRTLTEQVQDDKVISSIRDALLSAQKIIYLGFGFNTMNMQLLSSPEPALYRADIYATVYGMSSSEQTVVRRLLSSETNDLQKCEFLNSKCVEMMKHFGREICT